jgi:hypothetical protein
MKIIEILLDDVAQSTATPTTPAKKFQDIATLQKDPDALVNTWAPRLNQLQARCNSMLARHVE